MIFDKIMKGVHRAEKEFVIVVFAAMTIVTFVAAVNRFTFKIAMPWSEELVKYLLLWLTMVGSGLAVGTGGHVGIDIFVNAMPDKMRKFVRNLMNLVGCAFSILFLTAGIELVQKQYIQKSTAMNISLGWVYSCIIAGAILMFLEFLYLFFNSTRRKNKENLLEGGETK